MEQPTKRLRTTKDDFSCQCRCAHPRSMEQLAAHELDEHRVDWYRCTCRICGGPDGCEVNVPFVWKAFRGDLCESYRECDCYRPALGLQESPDTDSDDMEKSAEALGRKATNSGDKTENAETLGRKGKVGPPPSPSGSAEAESTRADGPSLLHFLYKRVVPSIIIGPTTSTVSHSTLMVVNTFIEYVESYWCAGRSNVISYAVEYDEDGKAIYGWNNSWRRRTALTNIGPGRLLSCIAGA